MFRSNHRNGRHLTETLCQGAVVAGGPAWVLSAFGRVETFAWGIATSMSAEASPFHTPIARQDTDDDVVFSWSTDDPPLHARYRLEWKFRNPEEETLPVQALSPAAQMRSLDIVQEGDAILAEVARPFDLPAEADDARRVVAGW